MMAWFPHLKSALVKKLNITLRKSIRVAIGLPMDTRIEALMFEAELDTCEQLAVKSAVSLYTQIKPENEEINSIAKNAFKRMEPIWTKHLYEIPHTVWEGRIQPKVQAILQSDQITVDLTTLKNQNQTDEKEAKYEDILYTDASVDVWNNPPGKASIGYIWYTKNEKELWEVSKQGTSFIGHFHSSYSAEAVALTEAMKNCPNNIRGNTAKPIGVFTDSMSNLMTIDRGRADAPEQQELFRALTEGNRKINLYHTKSHVGILRNEEVDKLCNLKAQNKHRTTINKSGTKTAEQLKEWTKKWAQKKRLDSLLNCKPKTDGPSMTKHFMTRLIESKKRPPSNHKHLPRRLGVTFSKMRTNRWTDGNKYRHKIDKDSSPTCAACETEDRKLEESWQHTLDVCEGYEEERQKILTQLKYKYNKLSQMLFSENTLETKLLENFLSKVNENKSKQEGKKQQRSNKTKKKTIKERN